MKVYEGHDVRNVALIGHGNSGKTSLAAGIAFTTGVTNRLTRVEEGNTVTDFDEEEIARKITISSSVLACEWKKTKINLIDTPGFNIFLNEAKTTLNAADGALLMVDGVAGVEVGTEKTWNYCEEFKLPRALVINKLDRERSSFERTLEAIHENFGRHCVPVHLPIGSEKDFQGVIDLVRMKAYIYKADGDGKAVEQEIPANLKEEADKYHAALVEAVAEGEDELMEEFFAQGTLPAEHIIKGLREEMEMLAIFPVFCASALHNIGTDQILELCAEYMPAPTHRKGALGTAQENSPRAVSDKESHSVFVFKTVSDPFTGRISYFKVCSGVIRNDVNLVNQRNQGAERLSHIGVPQGKTIVPVTELKAGDIGAVAKLKETLSGDTLCDKAAPVVYPAVSLPEPSIAYAIHAKSRNDEDKMGNAITKVLEEDPALRFYRDPQTKEFLLAGNGQQHVEIVVSKLRKRYHVDVELQAPKIPYRETIRGHADVQGRHKKQTGGHGQFGDCKIKMDPLPRGGKFEFVNSTFGGSIPRQYIPAVEKGIVEAAEKGYLAGYPVVDFRVTVYDGSYHDVDSSEMSFKQAARKAFKAAMAIAKPALLEPIMTVEIQAPVEFAGDLMGDLNGRRGRISGTDTKGGAQIVKAQVPMSEMLTYASDLTSMTQGRGSFSMEFDHYDFVPAPQADKIIAAAKAARAGEEEEEE